MCAERDDYKQKCEELEAQLHQVLERNRTLAQENEEIPFLRDSVEEMKYMENKVVSAMMRTQQHGGGVTGVYGWSHRSLLTA